MAGALLAGGGGNKRGQGAAHRWRRGQARAGHRSPGAEGPSAAGRHSTVVEGPSETGAPLVGGGGAEHGWGATRRWFGEDGLEQRREATGVEEDEGVGWGTTGGNRTKRYLCNEWQLRVITSNSTRTHETLVCGVPSEKLHEKHGVGPKLYLFLGAEFVELDLFGRKVWKQRYKRWSRAVPNRPLIAKFHSLAIM